MSRPGNNQNQFIAIGLATAAVASLACYYYVSSQHLKEKQGTTKSEATVYPKKLDVDEEEEVERKVVPGSAADQTPKSSTEGDDEKTLHTRIEELDKQGKALFKAKKVSRLSEQLSSISALLILRLRVIRIRSTWKRRRFSRRHWNLLMVRESERRHFCAKTLLY